MFRMPFLGPSSGTYIVNYTKSQIMAHIKISKGKMQATSVVFVGQLCIRSCVYLWKARTVLILIIEIQMHAQNCTNMHLYPYSTEENKIGINIIAASSEQGFLLLHVLYRSGAIVHVLDSRRYTTLAVEHVNRSMNISI